MACQKLKTMIQGLRDKEKAVNNIQEPKEAIEKRYRITPLLLAEMKRITDEMGVKLVVVSVPMKDGLQRDYLNGALKKMKVPHLALDDYFSKLSKRVVFQYDEHWNREGHRAAADAIEKYLVQRGVFESD